MRIIVDSAAGSANDATSRILADKLSQIWGQQVVTLNQPGAGGGISAKAASQSPNDGYTLYHAVDVAVPGTAGRARRCAEHADRTAARLRRRSASCCSSRCSSAPRTSPASTSLPQLIEMAKEKPGEITYAATGRGRLTHLTMELLQARTGIKLQLVPYAGGPAQAMNDVMSGRVHLVLDAYAGLAAAIKGDLIKGLADTALERLPGFENLPTVAETVPDFFVGAWTVLLAPIGTPDADRAQGEQRLWTALNDPDVKTKYQANGAFVRHMTPEQVTAFVQDEQKTWRPILEQVAHETQK